MRSPRQRRCCPPRTRAQGAEIPRFTRAALDSWFLARTGYTGEDGFEIMLPAQEAAETWEALLAQGITPAGLGARDTLRLEAGMNLYGNDMDESHHPLESGLGWTVAFDPAERDFIGRAALERARAARRSRTRGLGARRSRRIAQPSTGQRRSPSLSRTGRRDEYRRSHERHLLADVESFHCPCAGARRNRTAVYRWTSAASLMRRAS